MARPLRIEFPGATHHVTSRGNERRDIFLCDEDRLAFLEFLGQASRRFGWILTAWVLMTNHFHLVVQTPQPNLSRGMHWLNSKYAGWFNAKYRRAGHLFQGRFKSFLIEKETYFAEVLRYVVLNPVRAGMVARPEDYRWSSYCATSGLDPAPGWFDAGTALEPFGGAGPIAQARYRSYVLTRIGSEDRLWDQLIHGVFLGSEDWAKKVRAEVERKPRSTDHPRSQRAIGRPKMHAVLTAVARAARTAVDSIRKTRGHALRALIAWIGWHEGLATLRSIAASLRLRSEGHISNLIRRCEGRFGTDPGLLGLLDTALAELRA
jgi:putative transposase